MPRAALAGDVELVHVLADAGTLGKTTDWSLGFVGVARSLAEIGDREQLAAKVQALVEPTDRAHRLASSKSLSSFRLGRRFAFGGRVQG